MIYDKFNETERSDIRKIVSDIWMDLSRLANVKEKCPSVIFSEEERYKFTSKDIPTIDQAPPYGTHQCMTTLEWKDHEIKLHLGPIEVIKKVPPEYKKIPLVHEEFHVINSILRPSAILYDIKCTKEMKDILTHKDNLSKHELKKLEKLYDISILTEAITWYSSLLYIKDADIVFNFFDECISDKVPEKEKGHIETIRNYTNELACFDLSLTDTLDLLKCMDDIALKSHRIKIYANEIRQIEKEYSIQVFVR